LILLYRAMGGGWQIRLGAGCDDAAPQALPRPQEVPIPPKGEKKDGKDLPKKQGAGARLQPPVERASLPAAVLPPLAPSPMLPTAPLVPAPLVQPPVLPTPLVPVAPPPVAPPLGPTSLLPMPVMPIVPADDP